MSFGPLKSMVRLWARLLCLALWTGIWVPFLYAGQRFELACHNWILRHYSRGIIWIMGVKLKVHGNLERKRPTLFVCNHSSYYDIHTIASVVPAVFLAKDDILGWPVIGPLCRISGSVFISRDPQKTLENMAKIKNNKSKSFILFPEGTTTDGNRVKKFNSAFFGLVTQLDTYHPMVVQPLSIAYTRLAGIPMGNHYRPYFSWFGDMDLVSHVKNALAFSSVTIEITAHPTIEGETLKDRKKVAQLCEQLITSSLTEKLTCPKKPKEKTQPPLIAA